MRYIDLVEQGDDMWNFPKTEEPSYATMAFPIKICNYSLHMVLLAYPSNIRAFQLSARRSCQAPPWCCRWNLNAIWTPIWCGASFFQPPIK